MKTVTLADLQHRISSIVAWVESGEDVFVQGEPKPKQPAAKMAVTVDMKKSTAFRDRAGEPVLSHRDLEDLFEDMRGPY